MVFGLVSLLFMAATFLQDAGGNSEEAMTMLSSLNATLRETLNKMTESVHGLAIKLDTLQNDFWERQGPCRPESHTVLNDARRSTKEGKGEQCDKDLVPGWYRFLLNNANAVLPTACVPQRHCRTDASTWLNLRGQSLPSTGQEVPALGCSTLDSYCCSLPSPVTVRNCGRYFVYKLKPNSFCFLAFCVEPQV
ncbi:hypothetical protein ACOMHN_017868 [Nucella lapillus]